MNILDIVMNRNKGGVAMQAGGIVKAGGAEMWAGQSRVTGNELGK